MGYKLEYSKQSDKDARFLERAGFDEKAKELLKTMKRNPYEPPVEKLTGDLKGCYSRRINRKHRIVYDILPNDADLLDTDGKPYQGIVYVLRMWSHYE